MLIPVAHGRTQFVTPGLVADPQGVATAREATVFLPTMGHLVGFLRSVSREQPLTRALPHLQLFRGRLVGGGPVVLVDFEGRGVHSLDRASALARLHQGQLYVGEGEHRVRYRDAHASRGYDVKTLAKAKKGMRHLYDQPVARAVNRLDSMSFRQLVTRLELVRRIGEERHAELYVRVPRTLGPRLIRHLTHRGAAVSLAQMEAKKKRRNKGDVELLFSVRQLDSGLLPLLEGLPGVRTYRRTGKRIFVKAGWTHPLDLASCEGLIEDEDWLYFDVDEVSESGPIRHFAPAQDLVLPQFRTETAVASRAIVPTALDAIEYPIRLCRREGQQGAVTARLLRSPKAFEWLEKLVYAMPRALLENYGCYAWKDHVMVVGKGEPPPIPFGIPLRQVNRQLFVPVDTVLRPRISDAKLSKLMSRRTTVLLPEGGFSWPVTTPLPLERRIISQLPIDHVQPISVMDSEVRIEPTEHSMFRLFFEGL